MFYCWTDNNVSTFVRIQSCLTTSNYILRDDILKKKQLATLFDLPLWTLFLPLTPSSLAQASGTHPMHCLHWHQGSHHSPKSRQNEIMFVPCVCVFRGWLRTQLQTTHRCMSLCKAMIRQGNHGWNSAIWLLPLCLCMYRLLIVGWFMQKLIMQCW